MNRKKSILKPIIITLVSLIFAAGSIGTAFVMANKSNDKTSVEVLPVASITTENWEDTGTMTGYAVSDFVQEIHPSADKIVSEIFVEAGQPVSVGDPLLQYEKEKLDLDLQRVDLSLRTLDHDIESANKRLKNLKDTTPYTPSEQDPFPDDPLPDVYPWPEPDPWVDPDPWPEPNPWPEPDPQPDPFPDPDPWLDPTPDPPEFPTPTPAPLPSPTPTPEETPSPTPEPTPTPEITPTPNPDATPTPGVTPTPEPTPPIGDVNVYTTILANSKPYGGDGTSEDPYQYLCASGCEITADFLRQLFGIEPFYTDAEDPSTGVKAPFAAVFEIRERNSNYGKLLYSFVLDGITFSIKIPNLSEESETSEDTESSDISEAPESSEMSYGFGNVFGGAAPARTPLASQLGNHTAKFSSKNLKISSLAFDNKGLTISNTSVDEKLEGLLYTKEELENAIDSLEKEIETLKMDRKQVKLDYDKINLSIKNSTLTSTIDGIVRTLTTEEEAMSTGTPFLAVSGEDTFYLETSIMESQLEKVFVGDILLANNWQNGITYQCEIVSINDYPTDGNESVEYSGGNPNNSRYGVKAVIREPMDLANGTWLDVTMRGAGNVSASASFYIDKMYVREDSVGAYVMKCGPDGRIVKQPVQIGKTIYNWAIEILSGLSASDYVAFPYGKDLKEGVRTRLQGADEDDYFAGTGAEPEGGMPHGDIHEEPLPEYETEEYIPEEGMNIENFEIDPGFTEEPLPDSSALDELQSALESGITLPIIDEETFSVEPVSTLIKPDSDSLPEQPDGKGDSWV